MEEQDLFDFYERTEDVADNTADDLFEYRRELKHLDEEHNIREDERMKQYQNQ